MAKPCVREDLLGRNRTEAGPREAGILRTTRGMVGVCKKPQGLADTDNGVRADTRDCPRLLVPVLGRLVVRLVGGVRVGVWVGGMTQRVLEKCQRARSQAK